MRTLLFLILLVLAISKGYGYNVPPTSVPRGSEVDTMIRQCFQTLCKEWMSECHWYCDSVKGASFLRRCKDCLSFRGVQCMDCFEL